MGFIEDLLFLVLIVHLEDASFPLGVGVRNSEADVSDHVGVMGQDSSLDSSYEGAMVGFVRELVSQFGFPFEPSEI